MTIKEIKQAIMHYQAVIMTSKGSVRQNAIKNYNYYLSLLKDYKSL